MIKPMMGFDLFEIDGWTSSPAHLFAMKGRQKRGPGTRQAGDQNIPRYRAYFQE